MEKVTISIERYDDLIEKEKNCNFNHIVGVHSDRTYRSYYSKCTKGDVIDVLNTEMKRIQKENSDKIDEIFNLSIWGLLKRKLKHKNII